MMELVNRVQNFNPYPANIFCLENVVCLMLVTSAAYFQVHPRLDFIMKPNTMNPREHSDRGPYCLHYGLSTYKQTTRVVTVGNSVN